MEVCQNIPKYAYDGHNLVTVWTMSIARHNLDCEMARLIDWLGSFRIGWRAVDS